ncbi:MAG: acylphosphatase [Bdellovibrionota bacterium]
MIKARKMQIQGQVQGVNFRESMKQEAHRCGVTGWVRNRPDGSVEAFVQGEPAAIEDILQWARLGPPRARVDALQSEDAAPDLSLKHFERRETA